MLVPAKRSKDSTVTLSVVIVQINTAEILHERINKELKKKKTTKGNNMKNFSEVKLLILNQMWIVFSKGN